MQRDNQDENLMQIVALHQKLLCRHEGIQGPAPRCPRPGCDQILRMEAPDEIAADLFAEDVF